MNKKPSDSKLPKEQEEKDGISIKQRPKIKTINEIKNDKRREVLVKGREQKIRAENYLQPEETKQSGYMDYNISDVLPYLDQQTKAKIFSLQLEYGPYSTNFTGNGVHLGICGRKGHIGILEWKTQKLINEFHVEEQCYGMHFFHTFKLFAVAQEKRLHIYDDKATDIHSLFDFPKPRQLDFLPYHFLLSVNCVETKPKLKYLDISTGELMAQHPLSSLTTTMIQNPYNAVIINGHVTGAITMWTPNMANAVVGLGFHKAAITGLAVTRDGKYLASSSEDGTLRFTDLRMMVEDTHMTMTGFSDVTSLNYSQRNLLAVGRGNIVEIFDEKLNKINVQRPGETHRDMITSCEFCPFEDFIAIGRYNGVSTIPIPGSGSAVVDTFENNIYESQKSYKESEVQKLLDKIPADMITLNPNLIGHVVEKDHLKIREEFLEGLKDEAAKTSKIKQHRREVLKKRMELFAPKTRAKPKRTDKKKPQIKPIAERSALDLFR
ncbi:BING4CT domain containing protein [Entamoeba histolytica HM-1:IMSS-B]|uniref:WD repeat protein n=5 Tax=Entamoeba histolytica TaxID=5759 RepID=C4M1V9_ENTH1|nr:WD repeat protein [Entamoeba histolytica HM-1:IMSS]EMH77647.1 BING4CT domain containing protein [Entamoeba histolytica HM-1:IMSS-B]EMS12619.1 Hypothetical protein KM1_017580 [Entamoeba histolytica HM-3:IMSS]ENY60952.1 hypothetical protein EHI7A_005950 [Entamoeba histolytica HM-1:IMSS-A]GAT95227.1 wd repeat protein [Entamoeba histolytica]EAL52183.1 WD repeat protein [Entamoeba histolytica HM-1:IMSS]|eukprot:XP_657558.1 WD repeat protein [Entamoeba histolytica HM-1:IMSS]